MSNRPPKPNNQSPNPQPTPDDPLRPNTKRTGERSEAAFLYQASQRRFAICKPWGDSERYDFILDNRPIPEACPERSRKPVLSLSKDVRLFRIQIKCTDSLRAGAYETRATYESGHQHVPYTKRDIDFIAAHVVPLNIWYILPVEICTPQPMLRFYPHRQAKKMRLEKYREAWHLLDPPFTPITINACADEDYPEGYVPPTEPQLERSNTVIPTSDRYDRGTFCAISMRFMSRHTLHLTLLFTKQNIGASFSFICVGECSDFVNSIPKLIACSHKTLTNIPPFSLYSAFFNSCFCNKKGIYPEKSFVLVGSSFREHVAQHNGSQEDPDVIKPKKDNEYADPPSRSPSKLYSH